jgi:hypothetical protein
LAAKKVIKELVTDSFVESAEALSKNGLSNIGRALQKHSDRNGAFSNIVFSSKTANQEGLKVFQEIINSNSKVLQRLDNGTINVFDSVTGRGFNISRGGTFNGFRELK